jgi:hypothetical protein
MRMYRWFGVAIHHTDTTRTRHDVRHVRDTEPQGTANGYIGRSHHRRVKHTALPRCCVAALVGLLQHPRGAKLLGRGSQRDIMIIKSDRYN